MSLASVRRCLLSFWHGEKIQNIFIFLDMYIFHPRQNVKKMHRERFRYDASDLKSAIHSYFHKFVHPGLDI